MEFKTIQSPRNREKYQQTHNQHKYWTYLETHDEKTGKRKLVKDKEIDITEKINAYKDEVNIKTLIQRYDLKEQQRIMQETENEVISLVGMPENMMEMQNIIAKQKHIWNLQSKEFKSNFGNSFEEYLAASENGKLAEYLENKHKNNDEKKQQIQQAVINSGIRTEQPIIQQATQQSQEQPVEQPTTPIVQYIGGNQNV